MLDLQKSNVVVLSPVVAKETQLIMSIYPKKNHVLNHVLWNHHHWLFSDWSLGHPFPTQKEQLGVKHPLLQGCKTFNWLTSLHHGFQFHYLFLEATTCFGDQSWRGSVPLNLWELELIHLPSHILTFHRDRCRIGFLNGLVQQQTWPRTEGWRTLRA